MNKTRELIIKNFNNTKSNIGDDLSQENIRVYSNDSNSPKAD
jgi:hypothetical protein